MVVLLSMPTLLIFLFVVLTIIKYVQWTSLLLLFSDDSLVNTLEFGKLTSLNVAGISH